MAAAGLEAEEVAGTEAAGLEAVATVVEVVEPTLLITCAGVRGAAE